MSRTKDPIEKLNQLQNILDTAVSISEKLDDISMNKPRNLVKKMKDQADSIIDRFYGTYTPKYYKRTGGLKHAYDISNDGMQINVDYFSYYMDDYTDYNQDSEIIFQNVFMQGFHGGSGGTDRYGITVPSNEPQWRKPMPYTDRNGNDHSGFYHWYGSTAPSSFSPYKAIDKYINREIDKYDKECNAFFQTSNSQIKNLISQL